MVAVQNEKSFKSIQLELDQYNSYFSKKGWEFSIETSWKMKNPVV
jgi:hypothetical protein